jgi:hypothetical protein
MARFGLLCYPKCPVFEPRPELQSAEGLWSLVDEPLVNEHLETIEKIEEVLAVRCVTLQNMKEEIKNLTNYHWLKYS